MTRAVPEWIGSTPDAAIPPRVKLRIIDRQGGVCACGCGVKLGLAGERIDFDHRPALINGGQNRESMIEAVRYPCHKGRTREDVAEKSKVAGKRVSAMGLKTKKRLIPGSKGSGWRKPINGPAYPVKE